MVEPDPPRLPCSRSALDKLGKRLAQVGDPTAEDLDLLTEVLIAYDDCLAVAERKIRRVLHESVESERVALVLATRVKTTQTIREKLQREQGMGLKGMVDVAGARVSGVGDRAHQDRLAAAIAGVFAGADREPRVVDRRARPSHGYRAVHVVVHVGAVPVEVQIRTQLQDSWAQLVEKLGDEWGRGLRYGQAPDDPGRLVGSSGLTRLQFFDRVLDLGASIAATEEEAAKAIDIAKELDDLEWTILRSDVSDIDASDILGRVQELKDTLTGRREDQARRADQQRAALEELGRAVDGRQR